jgi:hypothetical protein
MALISACLVSNVMLPPKDNGPPATARTQKARSREVRKLPAAQQRTSLAVLFLCLELGCTLGIPATELGARAKHKTTQRLKLVCSHEWRNPSLIRHVPIDHTAEDGGHGRAVGPKRRDRARSGFTDLDNLRVSV